MPTVNSTGFIKVIDQEISDYLITSGFSYIKEGEVFVFCATPELMAKLNSRFADGGYIIENKLRF